MNTVNNKKYSKSLSGFTQTNFSPNNCGKLKYDGTALNVGDGKEYKFSKNSRGFTPTPNLALFRFFNKFYFHLKFLIRNKNQNIFASAKQKALPKLVSGFTLLFATVVGGIILAIGAAILNVTIKQITLSAAGRESQFAFYSADSGTECAQYLDRGANHQELPASIFGRPGNAGIFDYNIVTEEGTQYSCGGVDVDFIDFDDLGTSVEYNFEVNDVPHKLCYNVTVIKTSNSTSIESRGYSTCDLNSSRLFERAIKVEY